jgi:hypothetical protein
MVGFGTIVVADRQMSIRIVIAGVVGAIVHYQGLFWLPSVLQAAEQKWTKRGILDDSMVAYEFKQQIEGLLDLQYLRNQSGLNEAVGTGCLAKWTPNATPNWVMTEYCYKR